MVHKTKIVRTVKRVKESHYDEQTRGFTRSHPGYRPSISPAEFGGRIVTKSHVSGSASGYQTPYPDWGSTVDLEFLKLLKRAGDFQSLAENEFFELYQWIWLNLPLAQATVLFTVDHVMSEGIGIDCADEGMKADAIRFMEKTNTLEKMNSILIQGLIYGNTFAIKTYDKQRPISERKIVNYTIEDTLTFTDISHNNRGVPLYRQRGSTSSSFKYDEPVELEWRGGEVGHVVHFKFYPTSNAELWGRSMFRGTIGLCMTLFNALGDLSTIIKRYASPVVLFKLRNLPSNSQRRDEIMDEFDTELMEWGTRSEWIYDDKDLEVDVLESKVKTVNPDILNPIERHIVSAFALPRHLVMDVANRSVADDLDIAYAKRIAALQVFVSSTFTREILRPAMIDAGYSEEAVEGLKFIFNKKPELQRELFLQGQKVLMLANSGVLTIDELRQREFGLGPKPKEEQPEPEQKQNNLNTEV